MAQNAFSPDAWTRARNRFIEDLSPDEKRLYFQATPETIFYDASAAEKMNKDKSTSRTVFENLQPFIEAIDQYGGALDVFANTYPLVMSPLWGGIRIVLHLARQCGQYFGRIADMFTQIGDVLPRLHVYERLFPDHERLIHAMSVLYCDVLHFCSDAKTALRKAKRSAFSLTWKTFDRQFGQQIEKFRIHHKNVEKEVKTSHMIESADSRSLMRSDQLQTIQERRDKERWQIFAELSAIDYEGQLARLEQLHLAGTGEWFVQHPLYLKWRDSSFSGGLCCRGIPGSGKSILTAQMIKDLLGNRSLAGNSVIYYFCDYADPSTLELANVCRTFLKELYNTGGLCDRVLETLVETFKRNKQGLLERDAARLFLEAVKSSNGAYIVVDGIDECEEKSQLSLIDLLCSCTSLQQPTVKVFVTCRDEERPLRYLAKYNQLHLSVTSSENDIKLYISSAVRSSVERRDITLRDPALEGEIVSALIARAQGMFLWVHFQIQDLCEAASDAAIRDVLEHLPDGLYQTYTRILIRISKSVNKHLAQRALRWVACTRRPLKISELQEAVAFDVADTKWDGAKIPDGDKLVRSCYGLIIREREPDLTVRFAHHTILAFLTSINSSDLTPEALPHMGDERPKSDLEDFFFHKREGEQLIQDMCMIYLCFSDFESALVPTEKERNLTINAVFRQGGPVAIPATLGLDKSMYTIPYRLFRPKSDVKALDLDFTKYVDWERFRGRRRPPDMGDKYALLGYVIDFWPWYTRNATGYLNIGRVVFDQESETVAPLQLNSTDLSGLNPNLEAQQKGLAIHNQKERIVKKFWNLILYGVLRFEFRPWGANHHFGPYGCKGCPIPSTESSASVSTRYAKNDTYLAKDLPHMALLHWAAENGHLPLLQRIAPLSWYFYLFHEEYHDETLMIACRNGQHDVVKFLKLIYNYEVSSYGRALREICRNGSLKTLRALLFHPGMTEQHPTIRSIAEYTIIQNGDSQQYLIICAASYGDDEIVNFLMNIGVDPESKDSPTSMTALHYAAMNNFSNIAETMLKSKIEVNARNSQGETPLILAAQNGHAKVAELLLKSGASVSMPGGKWLRLPLDDQTAMQQLLVEIWGSLGPTAAYFAAAKGHYDFLSLLFRVDHQGYSVDYFDDVLSRTSLAKQCFQTAVLCGQIKCVELFLGAGIDCDFKRDPPLMRPLALAARVNQIDVIKLLMDTAVTPKSFASDTLNIALHQASRFGNDKAISTLLTGSRRINAKTEAVFMVKANVEAKITDDGVTALHLAVMGGHNEAVRVLMQAGADLWAITAETDASRTVLEVAIESEKATTGTIEVLLEGCESVMEVPYCEQALQEVINRNELDALELDKLRVLLDHGARDVNTFGTIDTNGNINGGIIPPVLSKAVLEDNSSALQLLLWGRSLYDDRRSALERSLLIAQRHKKRQAIQILAAEINKLPKSH